MKFEKVVIVIVLILALPFAIVWANESETDASGSYTEDFERVSDNPENIYRSPWHQEENRPDESGYALIYQWAAGNSKKFYFNDFGGRLPDSASFLKTLARVANPFVKKAEAYQLYTCQPEPAENEILPGEPVLFIHGYTLSIVGFGGGQDYWGDFPGQIMALPFQKFIPFEFRWKTNARFEDVANDLGVCLEKISRKTGNSRVHIIAHSFGGILVRTLLQRLNSNGLDYSKLVGSVTTLGTPHSGIFEDEGVRHGRLFPKGRDSLKFLLANQISAHQMGVLIPGVAASHHIFKVSEKEGRLAANLADSVDRIPSDLPIQVGIGLSTNREGVDRIDDGDKVISFEGQRFHPDLGIHLRQLLLNRSDYGGRVTEVILGFDRNGARPGTPNEEGILGYRHSGNPNPFDATPAEAYLVCPDSDRSCNHASFLSAVQWLKDHPAGLTTASSISLEIKVLDSRSARPIQGATIEVLANDIPLVNTGARTTSPEGIADTILPFYPKAAYTVWVSADGYRSRFSDKGFVSGETIRQTGREFGTVLLSGMDL